MKIILKLLAIGILTTLLFSSCMSTEKATGWLSNHREDAANFCANQFPVKSDSVVITVRDTVTEKATEKDLTGFADSIVHHAYLDKQDQINGMQSYIADLEHKNAITKETADGLQKQLTNIKPVDTSALNKATKEKIEAAVKACEEKQTTVTKENTAKSEAATLRGDRLQGEKDLMTDSRDKWRKWFFILLGIGLVYITLRIFAGKLGAVAAFIK